MRRCDRKSSNARVQKRRYGKAKPSFSWRSTRFLASYGALCPMGTSIISTNVGGNTPASRSERRVVGVGKWQSIRKMSLGLLHIGVLCLRRVRQARQKHACGASTANTVGSCFAVCPSATVQENSSSGTDKPPTSMSVSGQKKEE